MDAQYICTMVIFYIYFFQFVSVDAHLLCFYISIFFAFIEH